MRVVEASSVLDRGSYRALFCASFCAHRVRFEPLILVLLAGTLEASSNPATLPLDSVKARASEAGVSERTQKTADKVAKASPEKIQEVARGEKTLQQAV
jgi:hypothetical protein